jgi:hypothetical protein
MTTGSSALHAPRIKDKVAPNQKRRFELSIDTSGSMKNTVNDNGDPFSHTRSHVSCRRETFV